MNSLFKRGSVALAAAAFAAASLPAGAGKLEAGAPTASVDPALVRSLATGPALAGIVYDDSQVSREQLAERMRGIGIGGLMLQSTSGAIGCVGTAAQLEALAAAPGVTSITGDRRLTTALNTSVPTTFNGDPSAVYDGLGVTGKGVGIAVLDTGLDGTHPDVRFPERAKINIRMLWSHQDQSNLGCKDLTTEGIDDIQFPPIEDTEVSSGHGTHMASVAAGDGSARSARYRGVAPQADLMGVGLSDSTSSTVDVQDPNGNRIVKLSMLQAVAAFEYAFVKGTDPEDPIMVKAILAGWTVDGLYEPSSLLMLTLRGPAHYDIPVVMPVGNEGPSASVCDAAETCHINAAAPHPNVIAVAASPKSTRGALASFSSRGDPVVRTIEANYETHQARYQPFITAPGVAVTAARRLGTASLPVTVPGSQSGASAEKQTKLDQDYVPMSGSSVAAAHVAGVIALMQEAALKAKGCYLSGDQVREILASTADPIAGYGPHEVGAGMVDATAAVHAAKAAPSLPLDSHYRCPGSEG